MMQNNGTDMFTLFKIILIFALVIAILLGATLFRIYRNIRDTMHSFGFNNTKSTAQRIVKTPQERKQYIHTTPNR